jgi:hypothetical protein
MTHDPWSLNSERVRKLLASLVDPTAGGILPILLHKILTVNFFLFDVFYGVNPVFLYENWSFCAHPL